MYIRIYYYFIVTFLMFSCSSSGSETDASGLSPQQQAVNELEEQVIELHDKVMPKMGTLMELKAELESRNQALRSSSSDEAENQVIVNSLVIEQLEQGHEGMMSWMRNFQKVDLNDDADANLKYLQTELVKIMAVDKQVADAITAAETALGE